MGNRILLVGSGGREHALAWKLLGSAACERLLVAPGNPGIAAGDPRATCIPIAADDTPALVELAVRERVDLVVCGPEAALAAGLGDAFARAGVRFFGPSAAAASIEGSKAFAKTLMTRAGVPTAAFGTFEDLSAALAFIDRQSGDVVVKADGLCAGKGVVVTSSHAEAGAAARAMLADRQFGVAGARVVIEERLAGREVSMMALCDGTRFVMLASAEDHKTVHDGDRGPNTGGMGAYSPSPLVDEELAARIGQTIFAPTLAEMAAQGRPFRGLLYGGLILTRDRGPMVIEWNCRFGDPETQVVLTRLDSDLLPWLIAAADGRLSRDALAWKPGPSLCVVLAAEGYPEKVRIGDDIEGLGSDGQPPARPEGVVVFHAGTGRSADHFVTAGGRVLGVTAVGTDLMEARARAYGAVASLRWQGQHFRSDIGMRGTT